MNNRILTSDGTTNAANAESKLTFDDVTNLLTVDGNIKITGGTPNVGESLIATDTDGNSTWGIALTASNVGTGARFYKETTANGSSPYSTMKFRTIKSGAGFQVVEGADEITISKDQLVGPDTYIYIKLDETSLGDSTRSQFYNMKETVMKKAIQDLYATGGTEAEGNTDPATNGSDRYDSHVFVQSDNSERIFGQIVSAAPSPNYGETYSVAFPSDATSIISMFFIDETEAYAPPTGPLMASASYRTVTYDRDVAYMKSEIANLNTAGKTFKGFLYNVKTGNHVAVERLFTLIQNGSGSYSVASGFNPGPHVSVVNEITNAWGTLNPGSIGPAVWPAIDPSAIDATRRFNTYEQYLLDVVIDSVNQAGAYREIKAELPSGGIDPYSSPAALDIENSIAIWTSRKNVSNTNYSTAKIYGQFYSVLPATQSVDTLSNIWKTPGFVANRIFVNWENGNNQRITLDSASSNVSLNFINPRAGAHYILKVAQGTTPRSITFGYNYTGAITQSSTIATASAVSVYPSTYQVSQTANSVTIMRMWYDGSTYYVETFGDSNTTSTTVVELDPVITKSVSDPSTISPSPVAGDRYLIPVGAAGAWAGQDNKIAEWDGSAWQYYTPVTDDVVFVTDTLTTLRFDGSVWVAYKGTAILQNGNTLTNNINIGSNDNYDLNFKTNNTQRMTILKGGNVGVNITAPVANLHARATAGTTASTVFKVDGNAGELFSVTDSLQGSLMSVNDISGLPILEVFDDNTVLIGDYQSPALNTTKKVVLSSSVSFQTVYQLPKSLYSAVFFEYSIANSTNMRAGTLMAVWDGTNIEFTETSTADLGSTVPVTFQAAISGSNVLIQCRVTTSSWTLKAIIRSI